MHSLLATLAELRVLLLTVFLSGAVHIAIFGGGWFDSEQPATLAAQNLTITVTAPRTDSAAEQQETVQPVPDRPTSKPKQVPENIVQPQETVAQTSTEVEPEVAVIAEPSTIKKPSAEKEPSADREPSADKEPSANKKPSAITKPEQIAAIGPAELTPAEITPAPEEATVENRPDENEQVSQASEPVYQQQPAFLKPPQPPVYPRMARKRGIEGEVMLRVELSDTGAITSLEIEQSSGSGLLDSAARKAVERWQFAPAKRNGFTVASYVRIPVNFVLE